MNDQDFATELRNAIGSHGAWKLRLKTAVATGKSAIPSHDAAKCDACEFGKWLTDPTRGGSLALTVPHRVLSRIHAEFHQAAGEVISLVEINDLAAARHALDTTFTERSEHLVKGIGKWITELRQDIAA